MYGTDRAIHTIGGDQDMLPALLSMYKVICGNLQSHGGISLDTVHQRQGVSVMYYIQYSALSVSSYYLLTQYGEREQQWQLFI
jgi:hypothetical protein